MAAAAAGGGGSTEASRSGGAADSYIGSLISLTSKSEIRYEGVLYNINTDESSIGLSNVRSFGTEGRKKDGQQVLPSDKVYEYILFRGSDIKDLQVKSSPVVQAPSAIHNDPAIIQSHYFRPPSISSSSPASVSGSVTDISSHTSQMGLPRSTFQGGLPLYQPGGGIGAWGTSPPPPSANGGAVPMPMYWQGFYAPPSGLPHVQQQSLLRPPAGLSMPPSMQQQPMQYAGMNPSLPMGTSNLSASNFSSPSFSEFPPSLLPPVSGGALNLTSSTMNSTLPSTLAPTQTAVLASESSSSLMPNMAPSSVLSAASTSSSFPLASPLTSSSLDIKVVAPSTSNKPTSISGPSLPYQTMSRSMSTTGTSSSSHSEVTIPSLVTPGQLLQPGSTTLPSLQSSKPLHKDVEVVQSSSAEPLPSIPTDVQAPILPLPSPPNKKPNGPPLHTRYNNNFRGHQRGRGSMGRRVTQFTEDFDFMAMNEKFNKDEVWGHLGKSNKAHKQGNDDEDDTEDEDDSGPSKLETPVYVKDDFFDTLSCHALDHASGNGRTKFSEQRKIDTETFGDFPRHYRGGRGGRGPPRGGRSRGPYYGRGYGYVGRGRGQPMSNRFN